jgi:hypothetical protein
MFYFDKYGTPIENQFSKDMPAGVTIKSVLDNYLVAIGGQKSGESRKTAMVGSTVIPQAPSPLTLLQKQMQKVN